MRKLITIVVLVVFSSCFSFAGSNEISLKTGLSAHDHPLDNGFILRVGIGFTSKKYFLTEETVDANQGGDEYVANTTYGIELGSQWYVWRDGAETMGLAVNLNWLDFQAGIASTEDYTNTYFDISAIEVGPMYSFAFTDDIGVDAFFNFKPNALFQASTNDVNDNEASAKWGIGLTYAAGASFRWKALLVGFEYGFGKIKLNDTDNSDLSAKVYTNVFKINLGVKL